MDRSGVLLVVEDQPDEREALTRFLRSEHFETVSVASASGAMEFIDGSVDLVLSDVRLGSSDGIDLLKAWKRRRPETPFILLTAFGAIGAAVDAVKAGAEDYLVKPVSPRELLEKIARSLQKGRAPWNVGGSGLRGDFGKARPDGEPGSHSAPPAGVPLEEIERVAIERTLRECGGNRTHTAQALGISVRTLQRKLKAWSEAANVAVTPEN